MCVFIYFWDVNNICQHSLLIKTVYWHRLTTINQLRSAWSMILVHLTFILEAMWFHQRAQVDRCFLSLCVIYTMYCAVVGILIINRQLWLTFDALLLFILDHTQGSTQDFRKTEVQNSVCPKHFFLLSWSTYVHFRTF